MKPGRLLAWSLAACLALLVRPAEARGQAREPVRLLYSRDAASSDACPSAEALQADVSVRLGFSPFSANDGARAAIEVEVLRSRATWQADVSMRGADGSLRGSRHVESGAADCRSLASATALAIALMIEPALLTRAPEVLTLEPTPAPVPPALPAPHHDDVSPDHAPATSPRAVEAAKGALASGVSLGLGLLPRPALGFSLRGELVLRGPLLIALEARYFAEQRWSRAGAESAFGMTLGSVGPCYRLPLAAGFSVAGCASLLVGALSLSVSSPEPLGAGARAWLGAEAALRVAYGAGALRLELSAAGFSHWGRRDYVVQRLVPSRTELLFAEPGVGLLSSAVVGVAF
jgi:hypothetical protein